MFPSLNSRLRLVAAVTLLMLLGTSIVWACQVPVFRYALERWQADGYTVVFTPGKSGALSKGEKAAFNFLEKAAASDEFPANLQVKLSETPLPESEVGTMALVYPQKIRGLEQSPMWSGSASVENARKIFDSPARREMVKQILSGKSAVWLVVESGNKSLDGKAIAEMNSVISDAPNTLRIPEGVVQQSDLGTANLPTNRPIDPENILQSNVPLKIDFGMIRVSRDDPAEAILLQMLLNLEGDLGDFAAEPMVFPVFGRGRVLEPLIGRGISEINAMDYAGYLTGACSCEVKDQNPGMDLLVAANWDLALEGSEVIIEKILPPLEGLTGLSAPAALPGGGEGSGFSSKISENNSGFIEGETSEYTDVVFEEVSFSIWWTVGAVVLLVIVIGSVIILRKKKS